MGAETGVVIIKRLQVTKRERGLRGILGGGVTGQSLRLPGEDDLALHHSSLPLAPFVRQSRIRAVNLPGKGRRMKRYIINMSFLKVEFEA
jgi:hypothetical protein